jgi:hypothetical protein
MFLSAIFLTGMITHFISSNIMNNQLYYFS